MGGTWAGSISVQGAAAAAHPCLRCGMPSAFVPPFSPQVALRVAVPLEPGARGNGARFLPPPPRPGAAGDGRRRLRWWRPARGGRRAGAAGLHAVAQPGAAHGPDERPAARQHLQALAVGPGACFPPSFLLPLGATVPCTEMAVCLPPLPCVPCPAWHPRAAPSPASAHAPSPPSLHPPAAPHADDGDQAQPPAVLRRPRHAGSSQWQPRTPACCTPLPAGRRVQRRRRRHACAPPTCQPCRRAWACCCPPCCSTATNWSSAGEGRVQKVGACMAPPPGVGSHAT